MRLQMSFSCAHDDFNRYEPSPGISLTTPLFSAHHFALEAALLDAYQISLQHLQELQSQAYSAASMPDLLCSPIWLDWSDGFGSAAHAAQLAVHLLSDAACRGRCISLSDSSHNGVLITRTPHAAHRTRLFKRGYQTTLSVRPVPEFHG